MYNDDCVNTATWYRIGPLFCFVCFLGLHVQNMEVPRLGIKRELQLLAYTTATATWDLSCVFDLTPQLTAMPDP